jgi:hypothetical protein
VDRSSKVLHFFVFIISDDLAAQRQRSTPGQYQPQRGRTRQCLPPSRLHLHLPLQSHLLPSVPIHPSSYFIIGNFFSDVNTFIIVVLLSALDFWTVKNVTGRLLVGLRWWNDFDENGKEIWRFESYDKEFQANAIDKSFFWTSQYASTATWAVFFVMKVLSFSIFWVKDQLSSRCSCSST